jgi:hypothetical protein
MECNAAREIAEVLTQDEAAAMQAGLQRLRLDPKHRAGLFGREPLDIAQHEGNPVHGWQMRELLNQPRTHIAANNLIVGER